MLSNNVRFIERDLKENNVQPSFGFVEQRMVAEMLQEPVKTRAINHGSFIISEVGKTS